MAFHENNGNCTGCSRILHRYPGIYPDLRDWFLRFQKDHPEAHVSCAGRGQMDQETLLLRRATKAPWGKSAHNYNAALDIFENQGDKKNIYEADWFNNVLYPNLPDFLDWYGMPEAPFRELPHVEVENWQQLAQEGILKLVE